MRIEKIDSAAARDRDQRIGLSGLPVELRGLQMHTGERANHLRWLNSSVPISMSYP
jgi:hypothetical protein